MSEPSVGEDVISSLDFPYDDLEAFSVIGNQAEVRNLLAEGACVNGHPLLQTPLYGACSQGHTAIATLLLDAGADIERGRGNSRNSSTPLTIAMSMRHVDTVRLLLDRGAALTHPPRDTSDCRYECDSDDTSDEDEAAPSRSGHDAVTWARRLCQIDTGYTEHRVARDKIVAMVVSERAARRWSRLRRLVPLVGRLRKALILLHDEVHYRPSGGGAVKAQAEFLRMQIYQLQHRH